MRSIQQSLMSGEPSPRESGGVVAGAGASMLLLAMAALLSGSAAAQTASAPAPAPAPAVPVQAVSAPAAPPATAKEVVKEGYSVHQTADLGGHIASVSGSGAMYATLINIHSGPRVLGETFELHALPDSKHFLVDNLFASSSGFGGDPLNVATLRMSKGKLYDFQGMFRRDRQYFDYNLLGNPLVPAGLVSNGYTFPQVTDSPHLYNTVRRMTDVNLTILPVAKVSLRFGYAQNIAEGPSYSSVHEGTEGLLLQNWRNSTDSYFGALDWKPVPKTTFTYEERVTHYKGDTSWQAAGLNLRLSNGAPVSLGYDNITVPVCSTTTGGTILSSTTTPPTANPMCSGFLQYTRTEPTRTLFPTEEFLFQSSSVTNVHMNGHFSYTGANSKLPNFNEYFNGLGRSGLRIQTITGSSSAKRVNLAADYGLVWQISDKVSLSEQFDLWYYRQPGTNTLSTISQSNPGPASSYNMLTAPTVTTPAAVATTNTFLGQKTETNNLTAAWQASPRASISLGYRYRARAINVNPGASPYVVNIHENGGVLGAVLRPSPQWRINGTAEALYADKSYTQVGPRATQHYNLRATYKPKAWATLAGAFNDLERRDNVQHVNRLEHSRNLSVGASLAPSERYSLDLNYAYTDVYMQQTICYVITPAPAGAIPIPAGTACGTNIYQSTDFYDSPTEFGSFALNLSPVRKLHSSVGYRISSVNGSTLYLNPRQVPGALVSKYQSPFANLALTPHAGWIWKASWNYYDYGETGLVGPTAPRDFHASVVTLAMHYEF